MLVERYQTKGAVIESFNDAYAGQEEEELEKRRQGFFQTAQRLLCQNLQEEKESF